jgi:hypothetical protein
MNVRIAGLFGLAALVAGAAVSCKSDPTAEGIGSANSVVMNLKVMNVIIADSSRSFATVFDTKSDPLTLPVSFASCDPVVAAVSPASDAPLPRSAFFVKGVTFGSTCVVATADGKTDTTQVSTFPARIVVTGGPDTLLSGSSSLYTFQYLDGVNQPVAGVPDPTFQSSDNSIALPLSTLGLVQGKSPGSATLTIQGPPESGNLVVTKGVLVVPGSFVGNISPSSASPGDFVKITNGGPGFDSDTRVFIDGIETFQVTATADSIRFVMPPTGVAGLVPLLLDQIGPDQVALVDNTNLSSASSSLNGPNEPANDDPATAPAITADGDYYIVNHGTCTGGSATSAGDDCDAFFNVTNALARPDTITVQLDWLSGADNDILWCDAACGGFVGNFDGATSSNPETSTVIIPAGEHWNLWINLFDPAGGNAVLVRVRITGIG